jgi:hypothetical protein
VFTVSDKELGVPGAADSFRSRSDSALDISGIRNTLPLPGGILFSPPECSEFVKPLPFW